MDQLASLFGEAGHALLIDCRTLSVEPVALPRSLAVVVVHCGLARTLVGSAYAERRAACEATAARLGISALRDATLDQVRDDPRARHVVTENARVLDFAAALRARDVNALGPLLLASHASLRDDYAVSTPELDLLVEILVESGAIGARLTGAGFGGCVVALVQRNHADDLVAKTVSRYRAASGLEPMAFTAARWARPVRSIPRRSDDPDAAQRVRGRRARSRMVGRALGRRGGARAVPSPSRSPRRRGRRAGPMRAAAAGTSRSAPRTGVRGRGPAGGRPATRPRSRSTFPPTVRCSSSRSSSRPVRPWCRRWCPANRRPANRPAIANRPANRPNRPANRRRESVSASPLPSGAAATRSGSRSPPGPTAPGLVSAATS